jgi:chromosome segregation ATPase
MTWICEFCGRENYQSDRIALKEPACLRCGNRRGSKDKRIARLEEEITLLTKIDRDYAEKIEHLEEVNASLWDEIASNAIDHDNLLNERKEILQSLIKVREKLQALKDIYTPGRVIAKDQRTLIGGQRP